MTVYISIGAIMIIICIFCIIFGAYLSEKYLETSKIFLFSIFYQMLDFLIEMHKDEKISDSEKLNLIKKSLIRISDELFELFKNSKINKDSFEEMREVMTDIRNNGCKSELFNKMLKISNIEKENYDTIYSLFESIVPDSKNHKDIEMLKLILLKMKEGELFERNPDA